VSGTSLTANFIIDPAAALGARSVTVSTAGGTSGSVTFTVNLGAPALASINPSSGIQGTSVSVALTGMNFLSGATALIISGSGVTGSAVNVAGATSLTATFTIAQTAVPGARSVTVATASGS